MADILWITYWYLLQILQFVHFQVAGFESDIKFCKYKMSIEVLFLIFASNMPNYLVVKVTIWMFSAVLFILFFFSSVV